MDVRSGVSVSAPFVWRCLSGRAVIPVSTLPSSNRTGAFGASGSRTSADAASTASHPASVTFSSRPSEGWDSGGAYTISDFRKEKYLGVAN